MPSSVVNQRTAQQINGREAKTATFSNLNLSVFLPTSSQPLDTSYLNINNSN
jgi:hypothetical protein